MKTSKTKQLVLTAMFCALAYIATVCVRIPITTVEFLKFDPKDVIIVIAGFIYGPLTSFIISVIVSFIEMITVSTTGPIGFIMNIISSTAFACVASALYKKHKGIRSAIISLGAGVIAMICSMAVWNYAVTPLYMEIPRSSIVNMLLPVFIPFNALKGTINAALTLLIYKPLVNVLRRTGLMANENDNTKISKKISAGTIIFSLLILATCTLIILAIRNII